MQNHNQTRGGSQPGRGPTLDLGGGFTPLRFVLAAVFIFIAILLMATSTYVVDPGKRGVKVTLGKAQDQFLPEGFGFKAPLITRIVDISIKQKTVPLRADCFSSDLQQLTIELRVLYRVPEKSVVEIYKEFSGDPFDSLIAPRVLEAVKEVTAMNTAVQIVKNRDDIKQKTLAAARPKVGNLLSIEDIVIRNIELSPELESAIEAKMVAEQEAARARFTQMQTQIEAETVIIRARGEAEGILVRGEALKLNPAFIRLQIVEKWNGRSPLVVPPGVGSDTAGLLLPLGVAGEVEAAK